jgi:hypothetical protein
LARPNDCGDDEASEIVRSTHGELWSKAWAQICEKDPMNKDAEEDAKNLWYQYLFYREETHLYQQTQQLAADQTQQQSAEAAACHEQRAAAASSTSMTRQHTAVVPEYITGSWLQAPATEDSIWASEDSARSRSFDLRCLPRGIRPGAHAKWGFCLWCEECKEYVAWVSRSKDGLYESSQDGGCCHFSGRAYRPDPAKPYEPIL